MGALAAGRMSATVPGFDTSSDGVNGAAKPGYAVGFNTHTLLTAQLPTITPAGGIAPSSYTPAGGITPSNYTPAGGLSGTGNLSLNDTRTWALSSPNYYGNYNGTNQDMALGSTVAGSLRPNTVSVTGGSLTGTVNLASAPFAFNGTPQAFSFTGTPQAFSFTGTPFGSNAAHNNVPSAVLGTWYIKL